MMTMMMMTWTDGMAVTGWIEDVIEWIECVTGWKDDEIGCLDGGREDMVMMMMKIVMMTWWEKEKAREKEKAKEKVTVVFIHE